MQASLHLNLSVMGTEYAAFRSSSTFLTKQKEQENETHIDGIEYGSFDDLFDRKR
jgi:hypothetical protein